MGIYRPDIYGDTLQWYSAYTNEANEQTISVVDTPVHLERSTGYVAEENKNMVVGTNQEITTKVDGRFILQTHCSFTGSVNDDYSMYWRINNSNLDAGKIKWTQKGGNYWEVSIATLYRFLSNETLGIAIKNNEGELSPTLRNLTFNIIKLY